MIAKLAIILAISGGALAQAPPPIAPSQPAQLTMTEKVALQSIAEKLKVVNEQMKVAREALVQVEGEIAKNHPGFHLNESNGELVKDAAPPTPPKK
jgi:hypothetical protein